MVVHDVCCDNVFTVAIVPVQGLEVLESVRCNQMIVEYQGKVMLREQYDKENIFFKRFVCLLNIVIEGLCVQYLCGW